MGPETNLKFIIDVTAPHPFPAFSLHVASLFVVCVFILSERVNCILFLCLFQNYYYQINFKRET